MKKAQIKKSVSALAMAAIIAVSLFGYGCGAKSASTSSDAGVSLSLIHISPSRLRRATSPIEGRLWHFGTLDLFARGSPSRGAVCEAD